MHLPRIRILILLSLLAIAGGDRPGWAGGSDPGGRGAETVAAHPDGTAEGPPGISLVEAPRQLAAMRVEVPTSAGRSVGKEGTDRSPSNRDHLGGRLCVPGTAPRVVLSRSVSPASTQAAFLARSGSISAFGTSLPPPPQA